MLLATDFEAQMEQAARLSAQATATTMLTALETRHDVDFPEDLELRLRTILDEHVSANIVDLRRSALDDTARIYARYFTASEIRELQQLQTHPVMIKFQRIAPQFTAELTQIGLAGSLERMPELTQRLTEEIQAWRQSNDDGREVPAT